MAKKKSKQVEDTELRKWLGRIVRAERIRKEADEKFGYTRAHLEYQNQFDKVMPSWIRDTEIVPINEIYAFAKAFIPSVYSRDPHITCTPMGIEQVAAAKIQELAVNAYWRELKLKRTVKRVILDAIFSEGIIKVGYAASFGSIAPEGDAPPIDPSEFVEDEEIFAVRVPWKRFLRDPEAVDGLYDARWVAHEIIAPIEAIRASSILENTSELNPAYITREKDEGGKPVAPESEEEFGRYYEIWDRDKGEVLAVSPECPKFLMRKEWPKKTANFPFALLRFNENPDECYAPNLIASWEPQLWEKIKIRSMQMDHIKRFNRQLIMEKDAMSRKDKDLLSQGRTASVVEVKKGTTILPQPLAYPQFQADAYGIENRIDLDKDNVSGQPNAVRSAPQKTQSRTLGEIDRLITSFQARQSEPQMVIEDFSSEVAAMLIDEMKQHLPGEKFIHASQKDAQELKAAFGDRFDGLGFRITKKDLRNAESEIAVRSGSTLPLDRDGRIETLGQWLKLGQTIGIQPGDEVSVTIGKNLFDEYEMVEVKAAFEKKLAQMQAAAQVQKLAAVAKVGLVQQKAQNMRDEMAAGGNIGAGLGGGQGGL